MTRQLDAVQREWVTRIARAERELMSPYSAPGGFVPTHLCPFVADTPHHTLWWRVYMTVGERVGTK